ncbi:MAG: phosphoribosyltransferase [Gammaproteobacteria bacterium]
MAAGLIECFVSYAQMVADATAWARSGDFDDIAAVIGVPRSGAVPASIIALHRNVHVLQLADLSRPIAAPAIRRGGRELPAGPVMVIEDTVRSGKTVTALRRRLGAHTKCGRDIVYGSLYVRETSKHVVDRSGVVIPRYSVFQWNWQHVSGMGSMLLDMDGVLYPESLPADSPAARPLFVPTFQPRAVVTGRGDHLRPETHAWLRRYGISCPVHMMPSRPLDRELLGGPAGFKAGVYSKDDEAQLFVESDWSQARAIAGLSGKPVLCTENWKLYR